MKKPIITIEEVLKNPYPEDQVPPFQLSVDHAIPIFGEASMEALKDFATLAHTMLMKEPLVVFWGLSGNLGCFWSPVVDPEMNMDMLNAKIMFSKPAQPFTVSRQSGFDLTRERMGDLILREIPFEDAMLVVQGKKQPPQMAHEELAEDEVEMDGDCLPTCRPGYHKCGK